tara:strand:+ start:337 stop:621 length:285 start_codon:yes stop_codon:yes gene_type:complete
MLKILFNTLISIHHIITILLASTLYFIPKAFFEHNLHFYEALPLMAIVVYIGFSPSMICPLTHWENKLRKKLGKKEIKTFIKHYYINNVKKIFS